MHQGHYEYIGGYHHVCGDIMSTLRDVQYIGAFNINQRLL